jgi:hypothetical protein
MTTTLTGWQPIETAPKDGTAVLVYNPKIYRTSQFVARWDDHDQYWQSVACVDDYYGSSEVTHWMPLPAPPQS